ncbi:predicted protein [Coccidioides posadasii str. Silveira]|uniref:Predicted protein n=1 Tax=Coccidioides posadasii (strain RMSCC 757 / Silveira) TaxID=443226 RepID=E9DIZ7_COCPS|nr:predicted protein [Coccidioides posadasii str. Silveira]
MAAQDDPGRPTIEVLGLVSFRWMYDCNSRSERVSTARGGLRSMGVEGKVCIHGWISCIGPTKYRAIDYITRFFPRRVPGKSKRAA